MASSKNFSSSSSGTISWWRSAKSPSAAAPARRGSSGNLPLRRALGFGVGYVVVIWGVYAINAVVFGGQLLAYGVHPLDPSSLWHIFTAPWLHLSLAHLISNTVPGAIMSFLVGWSGARVWWGSTVLITLVGGLGIWVLGGVGTNHLGASILVYGWLAYLITRGIFTRKLGQSALGVVLAMTYSGLLWGVLPGTAGVSWQGHLFGAMGGILAGMSLKRQSR